MELFILILEIVGTVSFALSGAMTGLKKNMDIFGVCVLGVTTAVGGGILRDLLLGLTPPATFLDPKYVLMSIVTSLFVFSPVVRRVLFHSRKLYDALMLVSDSAGLGIFTVYGARVAIGAGYEENLFLVLFVAVITGVGGGVMRDLFAGDRPLYLCQACLCLRRTAGRDRLCGAEAAGRAGWGDDHRLCADRCDSLLLRAFSLEPAEGTLVMDLLLRQFEKSNRSKPRCRLDLCLSWKKCG